MRNLVIAMVMGLGLGGCAQSVASRPPRPANDDAALTAYLASESRSTAQSVAQESPAVASSQPVETDAEKTRREHDDKCRITYDDRKQLHDKITADQASIQTRISWVKSNCTYVPPATVDSHDYIAVEPGTRELYVRSSNPLSVSATYICKAGTPAIYQDTARFYMFGQLPKNVELEKQDRSCAEVDAQRGSGE